MRWIIYIKGYRIPRMDPFNHDSNELVEPIEVEIPLRVVRLDKDYIIAEDENEVIPSSNGSKEHCIRYAQVLRYEIHPR